MSVNNRARHSKRSRRDFQIELEQAESLFAAPIGKRMVAVRPVRPVYGSGYDDPFGSPEESDALIELAAANDVHLHFRWNLRSEIAPPLAQKLRFF